MHVNLPLLFIFYEKSSNFTSVCSKLKKICPLSLNYNSACVIGLPLWLCQENLRLRMCFLQLLISVEIVVFWKYLVLFSEKML
jgi:hypothetical protein